jgi:hypothetical protein
MHAECVPTGIFEDDHPDAVALPDVKNTRNRKPGSMQVEEDVRFARCASTGLHDHCWLSRKGGRPYPNDVARPGVPEYFDEGMPVLDASDLKNGVQ